MFFHVEIHSKKLNPFFAFLVLHSTRDKTPCSDVEYNTKSLATEKELIVTHFLISFTHSVINESEK